MRLDCGATAPAGARVYQVSGWQVSREGRDLDAFGALWAEMRDAVARRDYHRAVALVAREPDPRPFVVRYLLGSLPDDDVQWATNGASPVPWLERIATTYDVLYEQPDPKVAVLRELVMFELGQYVRYRFFVQYATGRVLLAGQPWDVRGQRLLVLGLTAREVERFAVADPLVERDPAMRALLDAIVSASPVVDDVMVMGAPRTTTSPEFFGFLRRLLFKA